MTSLIEKAAIRLEQLRRAGGETPDNVPESSTSEPTARQGVQASQSRRVNIDLDMLTSEGYVTPGSPHSVLAEQFRVIKRPLLTNATGKGPSLVPNGNLIMVTSAMPGEGKSFIATNLALSIAMELDHRVLLVDADVAKPSLMRSFNLPAGPGLLDLLLDDKTQMSDVMLTTNVDKLSLLPSGTPYGHSTELLASEAMTGLIGELGSRYADRIVIFDSPPLLQTTQARVLAMHMGQIVMVVEAERTLQSQVQHALSTIESCPIKLMLLNQARGGDNDAYSYGYGYGQSGDASAVTQLRQAPVP